MERIADDAIGMEKMPKDWLGDLPKSLAANKALLATMKPGLERNYLLLDTMYLEEKIDNYKRDWLLNVYRSAGWEMKENGVPEKKHTKRPSEYFQEMAEGLEKFDKKLDKIYKAITK